MIAFSTNGAEINESLYVKNKTENPAQVPHALHKNWLKINHRPKCRA